MTSPAAEAPAPTMSHVFGEIVWLMSQSPLHRHLKISDLEWLVMPALLSRQFYIFRDGPRTVGLALWARLSPEAEAKLEKPLLDGDGRLTPEDWTSGPNLWLVDLIAPFADQKNRQREIMMADLISGPLKGREFRLHRTDATTGKREVVTIEADASDKLKAVIEKAVSDAENG